MIWWATLLSDKSLMDKILTRYWTYELTVISNSWSNPAAGNVWDVLTGESDDQHWLKMINKRFISIRELFQPGTGFNMEPAFELEHLTCYVLKYSHLNTHLKKVIYITLCFTSL